MTDREIEASGVHGRFDGLRSGTARLASLPFTFALAPRRALRNLSHKKQVLLSSPKHQHRFTFKDRVASPELDRKAEVQELVCELTMDEDWISLAELVEEWDQYRSNCPSKYRLIHYALDASRETLTTNSQRTPQPDHASDIPDAILQDLETAALAVPDQYALKAICAQLRIDQGCRILRDHLTGIHADSWKGGTKSAVEMISRACQRELKNGAHFKLDLNGLVAHYPIS